MPEIESNLHIVDPKGVEYESFQDLAADLDTQAQLGFTIFDWQQSQLNPGKQLVIWTRIAGPTP